MPRPSRRGSAVSTPAASVSSTSSLGADELGDQRGHPVVVAEADLVVGDGVVLVDDAGGRPSSSSRPRVERACRYCWRTMKSSGASSTWPATVAAPASETSASTSL